MYIYIPLTWTLFLVLLLLKCKANVLTACEEGLYNKHEMRMTARHRKHCCLHKLGEIMIIFDICFVVFGVIY